MKTGKVYFLFFEKWHIINISKKEQKKKEEIDVVKVYLVSYKKPLSHKEFSFFYNDIEEDRRKKADRFAKQADKDRCVLAGALLRHVLGHQEPQGAILIQIDEYGKPYMENGLEFSLSHAGAWVGLAVSDKPVGLDIEGGRTFHDWVVSKFCKDEQEWYEKLSDSEKESGFYRLWTGKESYGKRDGRGMGIGFSTFSIFSEEISKEIYFQTLKENYYLSLCTEEDWDGEIIYLNLDDLKN